MSNIKQLQDAYEHLKSYDAKASFPEPIFRLNSLVHIKFGELTDSIPAIVRGIHLFNGTNKYDLEMVVLKDDGWHGTRIYNVQADYVSQIPGEKNPYDESLIVREFERMAEQSLSPEVFEMWEKVKEQLVVTRNIG